MDLRKHYLTENECYKVGETITVKGLMLHSTGVNNPKLSRYIDAPELAPFSPNHWNKFHPDGRQVCVHGFIGLDKEGDVATYQTLPWNHRGWGGGGSSNNTHIHVEICEGDLNDAEYFDKVYEEAVQLFAYLAVKFKLDPFKAITTHSEGYKKGIASNHADVMHWFPKHGKTMDDFRKAVSNEMRADKADDEVKFEVPIVNPATPPVAPTPAPVTATKSIDELAREVLRGEHGSGDAREKSLGNRFEAVQARVNELLGDSDVKPAPKPKVKPKTVDQLAREVIDGKHGSGDARRKSLGKRFDAVQDRVNELLGESRPRTATKSLNQLVEETIRGEHGSGKERMKSLGSRYAEVQREVNRRMR